MPKLYLPFNPTLGAKSKKRQTSRACLHLRQEAGRTLNNTSLGARVNLLLSWLLHRDLTCDSRVLQKIEASCGNFRITVVYLWDPEQSLAEQPALAHYANAILLR